MELGLLRMGGQRKTGGVLKIPPRHAPRREAGGEYFWLGVLSNPVCVFSCMKCVHFRNDGDYKICKQFSEALT